MAIEGLSEEFANHENLKDFNHVDELAKAHLDLIKPWKDRLPEDFKTEDNLKTIEGFENFEDVVKNFVELKRNQPVIPESPDKYEIPDGDGFQADEKLSNSFRDWAHKAGLSQEQVKLVASGWNNYIKDVINEATEAEKKTREEAINKLKDTWKGDNYEKNIESVNKLSGLIAKKLNFSEDDMKDINDTLAIKPNLARVLHFISGAVSEDALETGLGPGKSDEKLSTEEFIKEVFDEAKKEK